ncbi:MAG: 5'-nucleotidase C-terminal domain-containing protein [Timaviella obliquedivisa GSE-PSE-MK23-08B]|nr:5'-nucleotidase C-terminal domain-containing protein [Timaviella obliquedivisa GSE-PSE-MK23-08B]
MAITLQILHASDFEAGIPAIDDSIGFSAILEGFRTNDVAPQFQASPTALANTLTLSSGDNYIPGPFFNASSDTSLNGVGGLTTSTAPTIGRADVGILNALGIQASAFGNHEFDLGTRQVQDILRSGGGSPGLNFPYLSTNLDFAPDPNLRGELATNQNTAEASTIKRKIAKSTIITVAGADNILGTPDDERIGIVGATTPTLRNISSPGSVGVRPANPIDYVALAAEIQASVNALTDTGINKVILLAHMQQLNIERDELAPRLRNVDVIIAGGSNTTLLDANDRLRSGSTDGGDYPILKKDANNEDVLVVNTDGNYRYVGRTVVGFDDAGKLVLSSLNDTVNGAFATDDAGVDLLYGRDVNPQTEANANVVAISNALRTVITNKDNNITGNTSFFLNGGREDSRTQETNLGNLTADANLAYGRLIDPTVTISLKNGGGIRDNIGVISAGSGATTAGDVQKLPPQPNPLAPNKQVGSISQLDIENSLRFNNGLSLITVTAQQLLQLLEHGMSDSGPGRTPGRFPQVGGITFSFDLSRPAAEDVNGDGILNPGEDRNNNGALDAGQRVRSLALINEDDKVTQVLVEDGAIVGDPNQAFRMVTLDFLLGTTLTTGGDSYPFPQFIAANPALANRVDIRGETTVDLNRNGIIDGTVAFPVGQSTFSGVGTEQDALAEYLLQIGTFDQEDTAPTEDSRIQNLGARQDTILTTGRALTGTSSRDVIRGTIGDDELRGLGGRDTLIGFAGNDILTGDAGNDNLKGNDGDDQLLGGNGKDKMFGGNGKDTFFGGRGNNLFVGGKGADVFGLETGGRVLIRDFQDRIDKLGLTGRLRFGNLSIEQSGRDTVISRGNDVLAVLKKESADNITKADFIRLAQPSF